MLHALKVTVGYLDGPTPHDATIEVDTRIATVTCMWADRIDRGDEPAAYGLLSDGRRWECGGLTRVSAPGAWDVYDCTDPDLAAALRAARAAVAAAWRADVEARPEAAAALEGYRVNVLDALDRQYAAHNARWDRDLQAIARKFRRAHVQVGEQTVPGKCCVRSARGKLLGYADVWDGRWLGTVERL